MVDGISRPSGRRGGSRARAHRASATTSTRACCGSRTALGRGRSARARLSKPPRPLERVVDLGVLVPHLLGVVEVLPGAAAADAEVRAARLHPARAGLEQLDRAGLGVAALELRDAGAHAVAGKRPRDEDHQLAVPGDAAAAVGERVDGEVDLLTAVKGDGHG